MTDSLSGRLWATVAMLLVTTTAAADDGVTVRGEGTASRTADRLKMAVIISGEAELAGDAVTKFQGQRERFMGALEALGVEGIGTDGSDPVIGQRAATTGNNNNRVFVNGVLQQQGGASAAFLISERITVTFPAGDNRFAVVPRLYDMGRDLSLSFVPPQSKGPLVEPLYPNAPATRGEATAKAMEDARVKAAMIASTSGQTLGEVLSVKVIEPKPPTSSSRGSQNIVGPSSSEAKVTLEVRFALK